MNDVRKPTVDRTSPPPTPRRTRTDQRDDSTRGSASRCGCPVCGPGGESSEQTDDEIGEPGRGQSIEKLVLHVDVERDPRGHGANIRRACLGAEPRLLISRGN